jgi:hypothetical protein
MSFNKCLLTPNICGQMYVVQMPFDQMFSDKMSVDQMSFDQVSVGQTSVGHECLMPLYQISAN